MAAPSPKSNQPRILFLIIAVIVMVGFLASIISSNHEAITELKYSEFKVLIENPPSENDRLVEAIFKDNHLTGIRADRSKVRTYVPNYEATRKYIESHGVTLSFEEPEADNLLKSVLINLVPMIIILVF